MEKCKRGERVGLNSQVNHFATQFSRFFRNQFFKAFGNIRSKNGTPIFRTKDKVILDVIGCVSSSFNCHKLIIARLFGNVRGKRLSPPRIPLPKQAKDLARQWGNPS